MAIIDFAFYTDFGNGSSTGYYAIPVWTSATTKVCGNTVRQTSAVHLNERVFVCTASSGTTGGSEPGWSSPPGARGVKVTDGNVTWVEASGIAALNGDLVNTPNWNTVKGTSVSVGQVIKNNAGNLVLICTTTTGNAGSGSEPSWAAYSTLGATTVDNQVTWTTLPTYSAWANPAPSIGMLTFNGTWLIAGCKCYMPSTTVDTSGLFITNGVSGGTINSPITFWSVNKTGSVPPSSGDVTQGATFQSNALQVSGASVFTCYYFNGFIFQLPSGSSLTSIALDTGITPSYNVYENCIFDLSLNTNAGTRFNINNNNSVPAAPTILRNCQVKFGQNQQGIGGHGGNGPTRFIGGSIAASGVAPNILFLPTGEQLPNPTVLTGVDLTGLGSSSTIVGNVSSSNSWFQFRNCSLSPNLGSLVSTPTAGGAFIDLICTDSIATDYRHNRYTAQGNQLIHTGITRVGGASNGSTLQSWQITSGSGVNFTIPYESLPTTIWNTTVGTVTVTVSGTINSSSLPNNDDIWMEVYYMGSGTNPISTVVNTTKVNQLASGTPISSDASAWNGGGSGAGWSPFKLTTVITPQIVGYIYVVVKVAKASTTYYIDPAIRLS